MKAPVPPCPLLLMGLMVVAPAALAQEAPDLRFLEYLGSWHEGDEEWFLTADWDAAAAEGTEADAATAGTEDGDGDGSPIGGFEHVGSDGAGDGAGGSAAARRDGSGVKAVTAGEAIDPPETPALAGEQLARAAGQARDSDED